jgi:hypothetical protein
VCGPAGALGALLRGILGTHALLVRTDQAWQDGRWNLQYINRQEHLAGLT